MEGAATGREFYKSLHSNGRLGACLQGSLPHGNRVPWLQMTLVSSNCDNFCSLAADAVGNQKRPAAAAQQQRVGAERSLRPLRPFEEPVGSLVVGAFGFQLEQLPERARGPIPRAKLVIQG